MKFSKAWASGPFLFFVSCATTGGVTGVGNHNSTQEAREIVAIMQQKFDYDESFAIAKGGMVHYIKAGETVWAIAQKYGMKVEDLLAINGVSDARSLQVGTRIYIPVTNETGSGNKKLAEEPQSANAAPESPDSVAVDNEKKQVAIETEPVGRGKGWFRNLCWPVAGGQISSRFGQRWGKNHDGLDLPGPEGTPILAAAAGEVVLAAENMSGYGNMVMLMHKRNKDDKEVWFTIYAHNSKNLVKKGDKVKRCGKIAEVGSTGRSTGPHCHFEVREQKVPQNPLLFLEP